MKKRPGFSLWNYLWILGIILALQWWFNPNSQPKELAYSQFKDSLNAGKIASVVITDQEINGLFKQKKDTTATAKKDTAKKSLFHIGKTPWNSLAKIDNREFQVVRLKDDSLLNQLNAQHVNYKGKIQSNWLSNILSWILPVIILFAIWGFFLRKMSKNMGGTGGGGAQNIFNVGRSKAKLYVLDKDNKITFNDVAGVDEAKEELSEMIDFLRDPSKFTRLGAKLPKGVLLVGPPGTGKTLLARAVAGEANVPFFSLTGSDFVEMFVGVGAARVRDLFKEAKAKEPCIVFIDEIDAIGKSRAAAMQFGSNDERENTLNQLLSEMDGFAPGDAIVLIGSTNRPEVLDKALLRPGRFDRQVLVDRPDLKGRLDILKVHTRKIILSENSQLDKVAAQTPGFSGADLANICNEAALLASRKDKKFVEFIDFQEAIERIIAGLEKKNRLINPKERKIVAYHESGHAIVGYFTPGADPVQKVSIIPRGIGALGYTLQAPLEDRFLMSKNELLGKIKGMLGGRAAEEIIFGDVSTGASNDLERVTHIAYNMVTVYGMGKTLPNISLKQPNQNQFLGQEFATDRKSEKYEQIIDDEVFRIISISYDETKKLLLSKKDKLEAMAERLLEKEVIGEEDVKEILGETDEK